MPIQAHNPFRGYYMVIVLKYFVELMFVALAVTFCVVASVTEQKKSKSALKPLRQKELIKEIYSPLQIRPPPLSAFAYDSLKH